jgi:hypothetical protein
MKKWSIPVAIAVVALLMPMSSGMVNAQEEAGLSLSKSANPTSATVGDTITYTYVITNTDNVTINNISLEDNRLGTIDLGGQTSLEPGGTITATATHVVAETDLPGPIENTAAVTGSDQEGNTFTANASASVDLTYAASLQLTKTAAPSPAAPHQTITYTYTITNNGNVSANNLSLQDDKLGAISLTDTSLAPGKSLTATATYTVAIADLPGPIVNTATVTGTDSTGNALSAASSQVSVSLNVNNWLLFKAEILKLMGVPGKGIDKAPGLQKPFNPKSQAAEHHGIGTDNVTQTETASGLQKPSNPKSRDDTNNNSDNVTQTKAEILKLSGVEGKGIDAAPGLQKPFNPKSQAAEHAGKKDKNQNEEQLRIRQNTENHGDLQGQIKIEQKTKNQN